MYCTIGEMYRSSYFNPSVYAARFETLASTEPQNDVVKAKMQSVESLSIIKSMEKRINKYLHKQKKIEFDGFKTARNLHKTPLQGLPSK